MSNPPGWQYREELTEAVTPSHTDIVRAKRLIMVALEEGGRSSADLLEVLNQADAVRRPEGRSHLEVPVRLAGMTDWKPDPADPHLAYPRNRAAAQIALDELERAGAIVGRSGSAKPSTVSVAVHSRNMSGSIPLEVEQPPEHFPRYSLSRISRLGTATDPDIYVSDLEAFGLDPRTARSLDESLAAFRRGLYLASASLLGAVSEGAWYTAGEQIRQHDQKLSIALDGHRTATVIARVAEAIRETSPFRNAADELHAHATFLREIRNYGVHPRESQDRDLEAVFDEAGVGTLLMATKRYLIRLAEALEATVARLS